MDIWILVGFILVILLGLAPILAIMALNRTSRLNHQISELNQRIFSLETIISQNRSAQSTVVESHRNVQSENNTAQMEDNNPFAEQSILEPELIESVPYVQSNEFEKANDIVKIPQETSAVINTKLTTSIEGVNPNRFDNLKNIPVTSSNNDERQSIFGHFFSWLVKGNPLAKIGILLLFLGVAYLLNYTVQNDIISPQIRLLLSAMGCLALLGTGWWLRKKKELFGLILQGGAIGCLYITIFAAFKLYTMLPYSMAFVFMLLICAASIMLALLQRTISLAILASVGGYLAPILLSTGGGSHIILFSYYLMLSGAILIISLWQAWRPLNLVGMFMTYAVAVLWGLNNYQPEYYLSCQLFIIANLIIFNVLTQLFAIRFDHSKQLVVDNTLLFAPPFISIALQYYISDSIGLLSAFVSLLLGCLYLIAGLQIHKRYKGAGKSMVLGNIIIGTGFITLAIPLALTFEWTSIIWSMEGLLILWFGLRQNQQKMTFTGSLLIVISALTLLSDYPYLYWSRSSTYMVPILLVACFCAGGLFHSSRKKENYFDALSYGFLVLGLTVWACWIPIFTDILSWSGESESFIIMALVVISVWFWRSYAIKINWVPLLLCQSFLWLVGYYYLALDFIYDENPMGRGEGSLIWPVILGSSILFVIHAYKVRNVWMQRILHGANFWLILAFIATQVNWFVEILPWGMQELGYFFYVMAITLTTLVLYWLQQSKLAPMRRHGLIYWYSFLPVIVVLIILSYCANLEDGKLAFWSYVPLINPLDEAGLFSIAAILLMRKGFAQKLKKVTEYDLWIIRGLMITTVTLSAFWFNGILIRATADFADLNWNYYVLYDSRLIQTVLSISWALAALACMIIATVQKNRVWWFCGVGIFACVIAKLFLIDIYGQDGISRAISFIVVALLILVVGYFSPLPPKDDQGTAKKEIQS